MVRENFVVATYSEKVPWSPRRFYINTFHEAYSYLFLVKKRAALASQGESIRLKSLLKKRCASMVGHKIALNETMDRYERRD